MSSDKRVSSLEEPIDVAEYLFRRLQQVGIKSVHGVPGDYNLVALDYVSKVGLNWVGNVNELNGSYAADGYARVNGMSAMVTTFGVGELSAINGQAGSFAEYVPVVHIVGTPSTLSQKDGMLLHHTLGNGDFNVFYKMFESVSCHSVKLSDPSQIADQIDDSIRQCYIQSRPVYISLPTDMVEKKVEGSRLKTELDLSYPKNNEDQENYAVEQVLKHLHAAKNPVILVDACTIRHRALEEVHAFVEKSGLPTFVAPMGKGAINEQLPNYGGVYAGSGSNEQVRQRVESADLVLSFGAIKSDFNTAGFTYRISELSTIDFHSNLVKVGFSEYHGLRMNGVITKVTQQMGKLNVQAVPTPTATRPEEVDKSDGEVISHSWFWPKLTDWVREDDIIVTETGTSGYGIWEVKFKKGITGISQILWGSIGYAFGSLQGAVLAASESGDRRTILFTGDGSFQLTAQELSTIIRHKLNPIIFVICNEGYTIERFIHGMEATYNDVPTWRYKDLVPTLGATDPSTYTLRQIRTKSDVEALLQDEDFATARKLRFVELYMPKEDAPLPLKLTAEASAKNNAKQ